MAVVTVGAVTEGAAGVGSGRGEIAFTTALSPAEIREVYGRMGVFSFFFFTCWMRDAFRNTGRLHSGHDSPLLHFFLGMTMVLGSWR